MILVILASGRGSRLKKETSQKPKCLIKINDKTILGNLENTFKFFHKVIIISGYKYKLIKKRYSNSKVKIIVNKKFRSTNMVYSLFLAKRYINSDAVITYADIFFDNSIIKKLIKINKSILPLNSNWLHYWKKRMPIKKVLNDAENLITKKKFITHIGGKIIKNKIPKLQYMGLLKVKKKDFIKMYKIFKKINNNKIDFTSFLNLYVKKNKLNFFKTSKYWYEFDTIADLKSFRNEIKK